jgi:ribosomal-protein-serine acetyltransferase
MFTRVIDDATELRLIEERHAEEYYALCRRSGGRFYWLRDGYSLEDARAFIRRDLAENFARNNGFQAGIWHEGRLVGAVRFNDVNWRHKSTSLGWWVDEASEGRGLVAKAVKVMIAYAFNEMKLNRLEAYCHADNQRSRALAERLGFKHEGTLRSAEARGDGFVDVAVYGLLASEWGRPQRA